MNIVLDVKQLFACNKVDKNFKCQVLPSVQRILNYRPRLLFFS